MIEIAEKNSGGWIKIYRELIEKPIWVNSTIEQRVILITLLCMANHAPKKWEWNGEAYELKPGQFITSLASIVEKCSSKDITTKKVRTALLRFEKLGFLASEATNKNRLVTILNWGKYQDYPNGEGKQEGKQRASRGQAEGKQRATNKNVKNVRMKECKNTHTYECASSHSQEKQGLSEPQVSEVEFSESEKDVLTDSDLKDLGLSETSIKRFLTFWKAYPKKKAKRNAAVAWKHLDPSEELLQKMLKTLEVSKKCDDWKVDRGRFIPYPASWLNGGRWSDEPSKATYAPKNSFNNFDSERDDYDDLMDLALSFLDDENTEEGTKQ